MAISLTFFGTDQFAAEILQSLIAYEQFRVEAIVTQPDRPAGRQHTFAPAPVKELALTHNIPLFQPSSLKNPTELPTLPASDIFIVFHYGLIIPASIINQPRFGTINVHPSLLPKYRGASPIRSALLNGEMETGITIMQMDEKMDHGPILSQQKIAIAADDTNETLSNKIAPLASRLLIETVTAWTEGKITPTPQLHEAATFCTTVTRDDGKIDWQHSAQNIYNQYRGLTPWPGLWTLWQGKRLKLLKISPAAASPKSVPGQAIIHDNQLLIGTREGTLLIHELQLEGKKALPTAAFLAGNKTIHNAILGH